MSWTLLLWVAAFAVIIYFFMIRPNKKRQEDQRNMMNAMQPGTRVMLTSGIFGTIQAIGDQQMVIELAPGTAITVVKQAVAKVVKDSEEEFEYSDADNEIEGGDHPMLAGDAEGDAKPAITAGDQDGPVSFTKPDAGTQPGDDAAPIDFTAPGTGNKPDDEGSVGDDAVTDDQDPAVKTMN